MNIEPKFKKGDVVRIVNCLEAESHGKDKTWICTTDAQEMCGNQVVWLKGYSGYFDCDCLELTREE